MDRIPIDWNAVNWPTVITLSIIALVASVIGDLLSFGSRMASAVLTTAAFAVIYIGWTYYLHDKLMGVPGVGG